MLDPDRAGQLEVEPVLSSRNADLGHGSAAANPLCAEHTNFALVR
jgi:hypothetical protein